MMPMPVPPPPSQQARFSMAPMRSPASTETVRKELRPLPPPPSRLSATPVVTDRWGHLSGLGAETDRMVVQQPEMDLVTPILCGLAGFFLIGALAK